MLEVMEEKAMIQFLEKFTDYPFLVRFQGHEYNIGEGEPSFTVIFRNPIPVSRLMTSTSLALGEAYMDGELEIEGDLYQALDHFLGQMGKFSADQHALKKLIHTSTSKKNQEKLLRNAVYGNLKLMKKTLNEKQYADYARVLNVTLQNKGIEVK